VFKDKLQAVVDKKGRVSKKSHELQAANAALLAENASLGAIAEQLRQQLRGMNEELERERTNRQEWATARSQLLRQFCETDNQMKTLVHPGSVSVPTFSNDVDMADRSNQTEEDHSGVRPQKKSGRTKVKSKIRGSGANGHTRSQPTYAEPIGRPRSTRGRGQQKKLGAKAASAIASLTRRQEREQRHRSIEKRRLKLRSRSGTGTVGKVKPRRRRKGTPNPPADEDPQANGSAGAFDEDDDEWGDALAEPELLTDFDAISSIGASVT